MNSRFELLPFLPGQPFTRGEANRAGFSDRALSSAVASGRIVRIKHGWFLIPEPKESRRAAIARLSRVALHAGPEGAVASHHTAAALHGLPLVRARTSRVHLTVDRPTGGRRAREVQLHTSPPGSLSVTEAAGIPVTGIARTIVDLARTAGFDAGVCALDHALRNKLITEEEIEREIEMHRGRTGVEIAREVITFADGAAESPGESLSRCVLHRLDGIPVPRLQHQYYSANGSKVARTDFSWGDGALAGEFDGKSKYSRAMNPGVDPGEVVWHEKQREDRLRALGVVVIRWIWADLYNPDRLRRLVLDGLRRADIR